MVVMLVSEVQAYAHLLWNQGLHLWDSGQWSWPRVCVCVHTLACVCVCWGDQQEHRPGMTGYSGVFGPGVGQGAVPGGPGSGGSESQLWSPRRWSWI